MCFCVVCTHGLNAIFDGCSVSARFTLFLFLFAFNLLSPLSSVRVGVNSVVGFSNHDSDFGYIIGADRFVPLRT